jgi:hypothetical protein
MKNILTLVSLVALMAVPAAQADSQANLAATFLQPIALAGIHNLGNLINWKVGDGANYNVTISSFPINGTMVKSVTKDNGDGTFWFNETIDLTIQKQVVDIEMDRSNAKILKYQVNGQDQAIPDEKVTVVSQDYGSVTVPAGTFKAVHIVAKTTAQGKDVQLEEWANPKDTCMDGSIKIIETTDGTTINMEMTSFKKN